MEGMQYIQHRVIDGSYQALLHWRVVNGVVEIKEPYGWKPTKIPLKFVKDFELSDLTNNKGVKEYENVCSI